MGQAALVGKNIIDLAADADLDHRHEGSRRIRCTAARGGQAPGAGKGAQLARCRQSRVALRFGGRRQGSGLSTRGGGTWPNYYTAAADVCMWDILGKAVNRPIYKILSGGMPTKDRLMAYASSQHLPTVEDYVPDVLKAKEQGFAPTRFIPAAASMRPGRRFPATSGTWRRFARCARRWATSLS
jgi:L-alanine-DL-glutamate epimerase-like enolase superfamily enzyme